MPTLHALFGYIDVSSVELAHLELPPPPPVGQVVRQVSDERQMVPNVPLVEKRAVVVAWVPVAFVKVKFWRVVEPVASIELALEKVCCAVQVLALPRLSPIVRAVEPLYVPEKVRVVSVAVRSARLEPRAMPEMVEFARSVLATVAQVAAPRADKDRTNWLVQLVPAYSAKRPLAPVRVRAEATVS